MSLFQTLLKTIGKLKKISVLWSTKENEMKVAGFTIIKNAVVNDFPIVEAIRSILPVVDEMIVLIGDSTDETIALIESIGDPKIKIHHSVWNPNLRKGGAVLADETNKAFKLIDPSSTWAFYIQADEVLHEQYYSIIKEACNNYADQQRVQGLLFKYLHFYGTYDYVGDSRRWYHREVRIIRNDQKIQAYRDAQGFRVKNKKLLVKLIDAYIYHYGWVKEPKAMQRKQESFTKLWHDDEWVKKNVAAAAEYDYSNIDLLAEYQGTHPAVFAKRIREARWNFDYSDSKVKRNFKYRLLYWIERLTGWRAGEYKNYKSI